MGPSVQAYIAWPFHDAVIACPECRIRGDIFFERLRLTVAVGRLVAIIDAITFVKLNVARSMGVLARRTPASEEDLVGSAHFAFRVCLRTILDCGYGFGSTKERLVWEMVMRRRGPFVKKKY